MNSIPFPNVAAAGLVLSLASAVSTVGATDLACKTLSVTFDDAHRGNVVRLASPDGREFAAAPNASTPLFELKVTRTDAFTNTVTVLPGDARRFDIARDAAGTLRLTYADFGAKPVQRVVCSVRAAGDRLRWKIAVTSRDGWALETAEYPRLALAPTLGAGCDDDRFVCGAAKGGVHHTRGNAAPWHRSLLMPGPLVCAFAAYFDAQAGLYTAAEDPSANSKTLFVSADAKRTLLAWRINDFATGACEQPYETVLRGLARTDDDLTWHDAADVYRVWAWRQPWTTKRLAEREDLPGWMRDAPAMVRFPRSWVLEPERIRAWVRDHWLKCHARMPLVAAFWGWEKIDNWITPDYYPVVCGDRPFADLVRDLRAAGAHAFPWPSGYHWTLTHDKRADGTFRWDDRARFEKLGAPHQCITRDGTPYRREPSWLRGGATACLCGGDAWTRRWWNEDVTMPLVRLGCEMVQVDQVVGGRFPPCWSRAHGHAPGEGPWKATSFRDQLGSMRTAMRRVEKDAIVCVEEPCEFYNDLIGIQDYRDCECADTEWASVFNYVYHEYVACFQSNPRRGNRIWQAHAAVDGQIPFLTPVSHHVNASAEALMNGDFEQPGKLDAFAGWERVPGYRGQAWIARASLDRETKHGGAAALRVDAGAGEIGQVSQNVHNIPDSVRPGARCRLSAWVRTSGRGGGGNQIGFCWLAPDSRGRGTGVPGLDFPKPSEGWKRLESQPFAVPADGDHLRIMINVRDNTTVWVDDVRLEEVAADGTAQPVRACAFDRTDAWLRTWAELYHGAGRKYLAFGRQIRPPRVVCETQSCPTLAQPWRKSVDRRFPTVFCQAYEAADGSRALVLANATPKRQAFTLVRRGKSEPCTLEPDELRIMPDGLR